VLAGEGNRRVHYARLGYVAVDGLLQSAPASLVIDVAAVADRPSLQLPGGATVRGSEDLLITLPEAVAALADADGSESLLLTLTGLPDGAVLSDGVRSFSPGSTQRVVDLSGWNLAALRLQPPANFNGTLVLQLQASAIEASTGERATVVQDLVVELAPVADAPTLVLAPPDVSLSRERLATGWEGVANPNLAATIIAGGSLQGWTLVPALAGKVAAFEVWSAGDQLRNIVGNRVVVQPAAGAGSQWLGLSNGTSASSQALGIEQVLTTIDGARYMLTLQMAGGLGFAEANGTLGVYLDGVRVATHTAVSGRSSLAWKDVSLHFTGSGQPQRLTLRLEGGNAFAVSTATMRSVMLDQIRIVETLPVDAGRVFGFVDNAVALPRVTAQVSADAVGERFSVTLLGLPAGSVLGDGTHSLSIGADGLVADITGWQLDRLTLQPPAGFTGTLQLQLRATSTEPVNGAFASVQAGVRVEVLAGTPVATQPGVNPFVTQTGGGVVSSSGAGTPGLLPATRLQVSPLVSDGGLVLLSAAGEALPPPPRTADEEALAEAERARALGQSWLAALEQAAQAQWQALVGAGTGGGGG